MEVSTQEKWYKFCPNCKTKLERKSVDDDVVLSCPNCDFIFWNNPKPVVSLLMHDQGKFLMIQRALEPLKGYWCLPGGFIKYEEHPEKAVLREVKEETGLALDVIDDLIGVYQIDNDSRGIHIDIIYKKAIKIDDVNLSHEHKNYKFFTIDDLPENIAYKHREAILKWAKND